MFTALLQPLLMRNHWIVLIIPQSWGRGGGISVTTCDLITGGAVLRAALAAAWLIKGPSISSLHRR